MEYIIEADTRQIDRAKWLELRKTGIGGSDAGAILGVNPYRGAYGVWADKLGLLPETPDNEAMRQGRDLEDYVARRFAEKTGVKIRHEYHMLRSCARPWMMANIDRRIAGERAGLECKTSKDIRLGRYKNGEFPIEYYAQCLHYLAVTGWDRWHLAVLVYGTDLLTFTIERAEVEDDIAALVKAEEAFWRVNVEGRQAPAPDGLESTTKALLAVHPVAEEGSAMDADEDADKLLAELLDVKASLKALEKREDEISNRLKDIMGDHEELRGTAGRATWRNQERSTLSKVKIKVYFPNVDLDKCMMKTKTRVFSVKGAKEEA
jgi:putative phage-type endonuclease